MLKSVLSHWTRRCYHKSGPRANLEKANPPTETPSAHQNLGSLIAPKKWDKKILVYLKRYKSEEEIPSRVPYETIERARSRMRIRLGNLFMLVTLIACICVSYRGKQKAKAITEMKLEKEAQMRAQAHKNA